MFSFDENISKHSAHSVTEHILRILFADVAPGLLPNSVQHLLLHRTLHRCYWWCICIMVLSMSSVQVRGLHHRLSLTLITHCSEDIQWLYWLDTLLVNHQIIWCRNSCGQCVSIKWQFCWKRRTQGGKKISCLEICMCCSQLYVMLNWTLRLTNVIYWLNLLTTVLNTGIGYYFYANSLPQELTAQILV